MTKYYKLFRNYYKDLGKGKSERIKAYRLNYGIEVELSSMFDLGGGDEITEAQYNRIKRLVLAKLLKQ
jgi:hypothetical protein